MRQWFARPSQSVFDSPPLDHIRPRSRSPRSERRPGDNGDLGRHDHHHQDSARPHLPPGYSGSQPNPRPTLVTTYHQDGSTSPHLPSLEHGSYQPGSPAPDLATNRSRPPHRSRSVPARQSADAPLHDPTTHHPRDGSDCPRDPALDSPSGMNEAQGTLRRQRQEEENRIRSLLDEQARLSRLNDEQRAFL